MLWIDSSRILQAITPIKSSNPMKFSASLLSFLALSSAPLSAALIWETASGTYVGGTAAGSVGTPGTASGYTGMCIDQNNPHTFAAFNGSDLALCHDLSFTDSSGAPVLVDNLSTINTGTGGGNDGAICFDLLTPLEAGETLKLTFDFNTPIGTWETGGFASPLTGSTARFASSIRTSELAADLNDLTYSDITYGFATNPSPLAPTGQTPGPWDWTTSTINPNGGTASTRVISGGNNENVDFGFANGPGNLFGNSAYKASVLDNFEGNAFNFTQSYSWSITAGAEALPAGTTFKLTLDGTPLSAVRSRHPGTESGRAPPCWRRQLPL